jgi:hypothetical protein
MDITDKKSSLTDAEVINELKQASQGLLFASESEFPFEVFCWESPDILQHSQKEPEAVDSHTELQPDNKSLTAEIPDNSNCHKLSESPELITLTEDKLLQQTGYGKDTPIEIAAVDDVFQVATTAEAWHSEEEKEAVNQYQRLVDTLKNYLRDIKVYRLGNVEIDVYIVGITPSGNLAGVTTKVVET